MATLEDLERRVAALEADKTRMDRLTAKADQIEADVSQLKADVSQLKADVGQLKAVVSEGFDKVGLLLEQILLRLP
jgi:uncharacterized protein (DUF3084 family)